VRVNGNVVFLPHGRVITLSVSHIPVVWSGVASSLGRLGVSYASWSPLLDSFGSEVVF